MTQRQDFSIDASRHYELPVVITEDDGTTALDLTDCALQFAVSKGSGQAALVLKTSADAAEIEITSASDGEASIYIVPDDTEDLGGATYEHELVVIGADTTESTVLRGLLTISKSLIAAA